MKNWNTLKALPKNRLIKTSYFWFITIPIFVKIFSSLNSPFKYTFENGYEVVLNLDLPFSWKIFFLSSLLIVLAIILYELFCPKLIKDYSNFSDFINDGNDSVKLSESIPIQMKSLKKQLKNKYDKIQNEGDNSIDEKAFTDQLDNNLQRHFWFVFDELNKRFPIIRLITYFLFGIGILMFCFIICQNIQFTIEYIWNQ